MQKRFTFGNVAPAIWRWRWHWRWCCRPQQRSERGPGEARAQLCELHGRIRPPDCCPGSPWPTQIAPRSRRPSPQPKATSQGSTAQPGRDGPGAARKVWGVVHGVHGFRFALQTPIYTRCAPAATPRPSQATPAGPPALVAQTPRLRPSPPRDPGRQTRARCARRAALGRRASDSAPPPSLGRAPIPPDSSISKSGPRDLEFQYPVVVLKIESPTLGNEDYTPRAPQCPRIGPQRLKRLDRARRHGSIGQIREHWGERRQKWQKTILPAPEDQPSGPFGSILGPLEDDPRAVSWRVILIGRRGRRP